MKSPTAILIGFALIAVAIVFGPVIQKVLITPAQAEMDGSANDIAAPLYKIASAIYSIQACQN